jgi:WD40 repeat protein
MTTANPFPGLRPFESGETHLFFGRDGQSEELIRRLGRRRFLAVVGTSGSGKSSLVRAGLLPALQGGLMASAGSDWRIVMFRPGHDPVGNLARTLTEPEVFGSVEAREAEMQTALTEATLRRSSLGLREAVRQARVASGPGGLPRLLPYENLLVVVDQFEELFRFRQLIEFENSKEDAAAFVRLLLEAGSRPEEKIYVVLTMRSDFLGDCAQFQGLPEAINDGQYLIPRMTRDERREAVTGPVAVGGGRITDPLVNQLLNDMGDNPDQLPILQHALMRTWDYWLEHRRDGEPIDLPHYQAVGGMGEALSRHAEEAYGELGEAGQEQSARQRIAEKLFKALTEKGADNREIRRPVELGEAAAITEASAEEVAAVVEVFRRPGRSFLMPPAGVPLDADSLIDISHESLIRNWERLRQWTDEEAQSARIYKRLAETAVLHKAGEEALYKDPALQFALDWRERNRPNAVWARRYHPEFETAMSFLDASVAAREAERKELEKQRRRDVSYKRTRLAALFLALSFLLAAAASVYAYNSMSEARAAEARAGDALRKAEAARLAADVARGKAESDAAQAQADKNDATQQRDKAEVALDKAKAEKAEADRRAVAAGVREKEANVAFRRAKEALTEADFQRQAAVEQSKRNAAVAEQNAADAEKARRLLYPTIINLAQQAYESNDIARGRELLSIQQVALRDRPGFEWFYMNRLLNNEVETIKPPGDFLKFAASPDGKTLVIAASDSTIEFRDLATGETKSVPLINSSSEEFSVGCFAISPNGKTLALGNASAGEPSIKLFDIAARKALGLIKAGTISIDAVAFTADSKRVIAGSGRYSRGSGASSHSFIKIWDVDTLALTNDSIPAGVDHMFAVSPDGKTLALVRDDSTTLWDLSTNKEAGQLIRKEGGRVTSLAFSPDGSRLAVTATNLTVEVWRVAERRSIPFDSYETWAYSVAYSPDGKYLAMGFQDGKIRICDADDARSCAVLKGHREAVSSLSFSPDGRLLFSCDNQASYLHLSGSEETTVKTWDAAAALREQLPMPGMLTKGISVLAYSPDGKTLVAAGNSSQVMLLDAETHRLVRNLYESKRWVNAVAFSPDGRALATADAEEVRIWNVSTGAQDGAPLKVKDVKFLTFSRGERLLVTTSRFDDTVTAWDVASRRVVRVAPGEGEKLNYISNLYLTPDGTALVFTRNNAIEVWDAGLEKQLRRSGLPVADESDLTALAHSRDGRLIAVGDSHQRVFLIDARSLKTTATIKLPKHDDVTSLAFSPDGKTLVTGGRLTIKLWSTDTFRELLTLSGYRIRSMIGAMTFSPDGTKLAAAHDTGTVSVWRAPATPATGAR